MWYTTKWISFEKKKKYKEQEECQNLFDIIEAFICLSFHFSNQIRPRAVSDTKNQNDSI